MVQNSETDQAFGQKKKNVSRDSHPLSCSFIRNSLCPNYPVKANICKQIILQSEMA